MLITSEVNVGHLRDAQNGAFILLLESEFEGWPALVIGHPDGGRQLFRFPDMRRKITPTSHTPVIILPEMVVRFDPASVTTRHASPVTGELINVGGVWHVIETRQYDDEHLLYPIGGPNMVDGSDAITYPRFRRWEIGLPRDGDAFETIASINVTDSAA